MKKYLFTLSLLAACQAVLAGGIQAERAWARETVAGMSMGGVFLNLKNDGTREDTLTGGQSPVSNKVEVHTHINDNGVMRMRELAGGLALPKGQTVILKPGSYHIMLMGLKKPLTAGETFPLTLKFKHAPAKTIQVTVQSNAAPEQMAPMQHQHHH